LKHNKHPQNREESVTKIKRLIQRMLSKKVIRAFMKWRLTQPIRSKANIEMELKPEKDENVAPNIMKIDRKSINQAIRPKS